MDLTPRHLNTLFKSFTGLFLVVVLCLPNAWGQNFSAQEISPKPNSYQDAFYMPHELRLHFSTYDCLNFILTKREEPKWNSFFSVVTGFDSGILQTRILRNIQTISEARIYFRNHTKIIDYQGAPIIEAQLQKRTGDPYTMYWIGHRGYSDLKQAQNAVLEIKKGVASSGISFDQTIQRAEEYALSFAGAEKVAAQEVIEPGVKPNFEREEDLFFAAYDSLNLKKVWGKYPDDDWFLYQSIFESTYRNTNLSDGGFNALTGFFFNRIVFRGIKFFGSSIDPYIEHDLRFETNDLDFNNTIDFAAGLEWRPLRRDRTLDDNPWIEWIRNYRIFIEYIRREPIKDVIAFSRDHDVKVGVDFFKEWGIDLPKEGEKDGLFWGEYFGDYNFQKTNFSSIDDFDSFLFNSNIKFGLKWPRIPLPDNPINNELVFMPYILFEHVNNSGQSSFFQNRYFAGAGLRLMPFRDYRFLNSQWVFRTKLFFEYEGIGGTQDSKAGAPSNVPEHDYRLGVNISLNRF